MGDFEDEKPLVEKKEQEGEHKIVEEVKAGIEVA